MSLQLRLIAWFCGTLAVILLIFCGTLLLLQPQVDIGVLDDELVADVVTVSGVLDTETRELGPGAAAVGAMLDELHLPGRGLAVFDVSGQLLGESWDGLTPSVDAVRVPTTSGRATTQTVATSRGNARLYVTPITIANAPYIVAVVASLEPVAHESAMLRQVVFVAVPIALLLAAIGGWIAATRALRPVARMAAEASAITADDPDARLTIATPHDEMGTLGRAFNALLDRMRAALDQQRRFMADASHELRTPVSVVRTAADVTLGRADRSDEEYRESLGIVGDQARRMSRMVDDMFLLARADAGHRRLTPRELYFDDLVTECVRSVRLLASGRGVTIATDLAPDVSWVGDEALAKQLITNLLDNAVRHGQGHVTVTVKADGDWIRLSVSNAGPAIPLEQRARIFERFVKLDPTRATDGGAGLGLAIARWVAVTHGGVLDLLESGPAGTTFQARLPRRATSQG
jgi:signal transduction histidine kinase